MRSGKARRIGANLLLLLVVVCVCLAGAEAATRWLYGQQIVLYPRYHTAAHYGDYTLRRLQPNSVFWHTSVDGSWRFTTNAQGFRADHDYSYAKPKGVIRVLALGDSQTEGFEVRQHHTFSAVIERYLDAAGAKAEVLNTGISGFGTAEELAFLENEGIKYQPDVVVLGFFANDFEDNVKSGLFTVEQDKLIDSGKVHTPGVKILDVIDAVPPLRWLSENSYLYSLFMNTAWETAKQALLRSAERQASEEFALPSEKIDVYEKDLEVRLLQRLHAFCRAKGIFLVILDLPQPASRDAGTFKSSIPEDLIPAFRANSDVLLLSGDVLGKYRSVADIHVPHGQRHLSEFSHLMFGVAAAEAIEARIGSVARATR
jgi:hypothetical protein